MPGKCCVPKCKGNYTTGPPVSVHSFPKGEDMTRKWITAINRDGFQPTKNTKVCELHFKDGDFKRYASYYDEHTGRTITYRLKVRRLEYGAVPSVFRKNHQEPQVVPREASNIRRERLNNNHHEEAVSRSKGDCSRKAGSEVLSVTETGQRFVSTANCDVIDITTAAGEIKQTREFSSHTYCQPVKTSATNPARGHSKPYVFSALTPQAPRKQHYSWPAPSQNIDAYQQDCSSGSVDQSWFGTTSLSPPRVDMCPVSPPPFNPTIVSVVGADGTSIGPHGTVISAQQRKQRRQEFIEAKSMLETVLFGRIENSATQIHRPPEFTVKQAIKEMEHMKTQHCRLKLQVWYHAQKQRDLIKTINTQVGQLPLEKRIEKVAEIEELIPFLQVSISEGSEYGEPILSLEKKTSEQVSQFRVITHSETSQQSSLSNTDIQQIRFDNIFL